MTFLCNLDDIPEGQAKEIDYEGQSLIIAQKDNQVFAYVNRCPHLDIPLNWQPDDFMDSDGELLQCSTHGALFLIDKGECISGPCIGDTLQAKKVCVKNNQILLEDN